MNEKESVYQLVSRLCSNLLKESPEIPKNFGVNKAKNILKNIAFQSLLNSKFEAVLDHEQLKKELQIASFELKLAKKKKESSQVDEFIETIDKNPEIDPFAWLFVELKDVEFNSADQQAYKSFFKLSSNKKNVYFSTDTQKFISLPSAVSNSDDSCVFMSRILDSYTGMKARKRQFQNPKSVPEKESSEVTTTVLKLPNSWENIGDCTKIASFSSESSSEISHRLTASPYKVPVELKSIPFEELLNNIKLLTIGIESESFKRSPEDPLTFMSPTNLSCGDISDISDLVEEFLEAGTCFKRLKMFTSKNPFNQCYIFEGFIFRAFCDCVIRFLNHFRDTVYSQTVDTLLEFTANTKSIRKILIHITKFLNIHSTSNQSVLPTGSDFLSTLYDEYKIIFDHEVKCFFVECLICCCQIYFNQLQKWVFHGQIDDPHKEIFIYFVDHYRPNTKYFFDKAYSIRKQSVPGFLQGCTETILLCGKYTMLLKSYNQTHPLVMMQKPSLRICLSQNEISTLQNQSIKFESQARSACGESVTFEQIMKDRETMKRERYKQAEAQAIVNLHRWRQAQEELRTEKAEKREIQLQELHRELEKINERKIIKRMEEIQAERDYLDEVKRIESEELERENIEIQKRVETLKQLNKGLDEKNDKNQETIDQLKSVLNQEPNEDEINANKPILTAVVPEKDEMNNIIQKTQTEAQRNKQKIMSHNNFANEEETSTTPSTEALTDVQRNRLKIMGHTIGNIDTQTEPKIKFVSEGNMTELQKNRSKVLQHEFNIQCAKPEPKLSLDLLNVDTKIQLLESPMSVTSDNFSNEGENHIVEQENLRIIDATADEKLQEPLEDTDLSMLKAFEEAVKKSLLKNPEGIFAEAKSSSYEYVKTVDASVLSRYLQTSLMIPVSHYMSILNNETLKLFVIDLNLLSHFKSLRNYFLLMNGEFGSIICNLLFSKLESHVSPAELLNYHSLHSILDQALSQSRHDPNTERLSFIVQNIPEKFQIYSPTVFNMLTISYKIEWPMNLILNPETMDQYKSIFNYMLKLKRISWVLEECFQTLKEVHKEVHKLHGKEIADSRAFRNIHQIRHKMTQFVHCLEVHVTTNVLQISWRKFMNDLKSAKSIHCMYRKHTSYLKRVLFLCLLNKKSHEFQKTIEDTFKVILRFHKHLKSRSWIKSDGTFDQQKYQKMETDREDFERLVTFTIYLGKKIYSHGYQKEIYDLLIMNMIDINGYYSKT